MTDSTHDAGAVIAVRLQDLAHGAGVCVVVRRWPLATLVAYLFEGRECDEVRALLAAGVAVARGSRLTWPRLMLSAEELTAIERTGPPARPGRPLDRAEVSAVVLHVPRSLADGAGGAGEAPGGAVSGAGAARAALALRRGDPALLGPAARASYVRFDYGPWADLYAVELSTDQTEAIHAAARAPASMDADVELHVVRHPAGATAAPRLDFIAPRPEERAPWRELPP